MNMKERVKIFAEERNAWELERRINDFLATLPETAVVWRIDYQSTPVSYSDGIETLHIAEHSALIHYALESEAAA